MTFSHISGICLINKSFDLILHNGEVHSELFYLIGFYRALVDLDRESAAVFEASSIIAVFVSIVTTTDFISFASYDFPKYL